MAIQCFLMVVSIYLTGKALKKHFNDDETVGNSYLSDSQQFDSGMTPEQVAKRMDVPMKFVNACMR